MILTEQLTDRKVFSQHDFDVNDPLSKEMAAHFLIGFFGDRLEIPIKKQVELFDKGDLITITKIGQERLTETERKVEGWNLSGAWATMHKEKHAVWPTVDVPCRKSQNISDDYIMFNKHFDTLAHTKMSYVLGSNIYIKDTTFTKDEPFYAVPPVLFRFYKLVENKWVWICPLGNELV